MLGIFFDLFPWTLGIDFNRIRRGLKATGTLKGPVPLSAQLPITHSVLYLEAWNIFFFLTLDPWKSFQPNSEGSLSVEGPLRAPYL
jgi:hypothetical protein